MEHHCTNPSLHLFGLFKKKKKITKAVGSTLTGIFLIFPTIKMDFFYGCPELGAKIPVLFRLFSLEPLWILTIVGCKKPPLAAADVYFAVTLYFEPTHTSCLQMQGCQTCPRRWQDPWGPVAGLWRLQDDKGCICITFTYSPAADGYVHIRPWSPEFSGRPGPLGRRAP